MLITRFPGGVNPPEGRLIILEHPFHHHPVTNKLDDKDTATYSRKDWKIMSCELGNINDFLSNKIFSLAFQNHVFSIVDHCEGRDNHKLS